jgi:hypothetical protein
MGSHTTVASIELKAVIRPGLAHPDLNPLSRVCGRIHGICLVESSLDKRALYLKMASVWHQMSQR